MAEMDEVVLDVVLPTQLPGISLDLHSRKNGSLR